MAEVEFYRCEHCGNMVALIKNGGGTLVCCGDPMTKLTAYSTDAATEKHVPVAIRQEDKIHVAVGSTLHPMLPEHHIEWIALVTGDRVDLKYLEPGQEPKAEFDDVDIGAIYAYCNLHGLWKAELFSTADGEVCSAEFSEGCISVED